MPAITSAASAICGTHLGDTKLAASILRSPQSARRSISATLSAVGIMRFSFCSPSRGPTSKTQTPVALNTASGLQGVVEQAPALSQLVECGFELADIVAAETAGVPHRGLRRYVDLGGCVIRLLIGFRFDLPLRRLILGIDG